MIVWFARIPTGVIHWSPIGPDESLAARAVPLTRHPDTCGLQLCHEIIFLVRMNWSQIRLSRLYSIMTSSDNENLLWETTISCFLKSFFCMKNLVTISSKDRPVWWTRADVGYLMSDVHLSERFKAGGDVWRDTRHLEGLTHSPEGEEVSLYALPALSSCRPGYRCRTAHRSKSFESLNRNIFYSDLRNIWWYFLQESPHSSMLPALILTAVVSMMSDSVSDLV